MYRVYCPLLNTQINFYCWVSWAVIIVIAVRIGGRVNQRSFIGATVDFLVCIDNDDRTSFCLLLKFITDVDLMKRFRKVAAQRLLIIMGP